MNKISRIILELLIILTIASLTTLAQFSQASLSNLRINDPIQDTLDGDHTTQSEVSLAVFGQTVVAVYVDTGQFLPRMNGRSSLSGYAVSHDGGRTFQDRGHLTPNTIGWGLSDPVVVVDRQGTFYVVSNQRNADGRPLIGVSRSADGGQTFTPAVLISGTGPVRTFYQDKPWIAVDDTSGPFDGTVYIAWTEFTPANENQILFSRSMDGAQTFSPAVVASTPAQNSQIGTSLAIGPDGELYLAWAEFDDPQKIFIQVRQSTDAGQTWGPIVTVGAAALSQREPGFCGRSDGYFLNGRISNFILPAMAVDRSDGPTRGHVYVVYQTAHGDDQADVLFTALSPDLNVIAPPKRVHDDRTLNDQFFPAIAVSPHGVIGVAFYDRRLDPDNLLIDYFLAISKDGGATFEPNRRVTDQSFGVPPIAGQPTSTRNFDSLRNECYMGDYNAITADATAFYLAWGDNRNILKTPAYPDGRPDPDVYFAIVPLED